MPFLREDSDFLLWRWLPGGFRLIAAIRTLLLWAEVDSTVVYGILANFWGLASGPVTLVLIATHFGPVLQGFYYTFGTVLALQIFVELGLASVIVQFASHEWPRLHLDDRGSIVGDSSALARLVSIGRFAIRWYLLAGGIVAGGLGVAGYVFFSQKVYPGIEWVAPWFTLCVLTGINLWLVPLWSLLEGCDQISHVYAFRVSLGILNSLAIWVAILLGADLWSAALAAAVGIVWQGTYLGWRYRNFFLPFFARRSLSPITWRSEVWPLQWRVAISYLCGYFISSLFTPVLFYYHGAVVAGQMGMTWSLITALAGFASLWPRAKAPRFGMLIAEKRYRGLDQLFFRVSLTCVCVFACGMVALWSTVYFLNALRYPMSARLLPLAPTGLLLLGQLAMSASGPFAIYLRAHKKEPFLLVSIGTGVLMGFLTWLLGRRFGAMGVATAYLAVSALFTLPYGCLIWTRCRASWHADIPEKLSLFVAGGKR